MRMRLKYVIGGALLSLASMAASGAANAAPFIITEGPGVEAGVATAPATAGLPLGTFFEHDAGAAVQPGVAANLLGDTVIITGGPTALLPNNPFTLTWTSGGNDFVTTPEIGEFFNLPGMTDAQSQALLQINTISDIPEPASLALLASGLLGLGVILRRRKAKAAKA